MIGIPTVLLSVVGITIVGYIGGTVIAEMGGKMISLAWNMVCGVAATGIALKWVWEKIHEVYSVVTHF